MLRILAAVCKSSQVLWVFLMIHPVSHTESLPPNSSDTQQHFSPHPPPSATSEAAPLEIGTNIPPDTNPANTTELEALIQTPLPLGKTLIVYHPHACRCAIFMVSNFDF